MKKITYNSTLGELYDTPVGHDVVEKILLTLGIPKKMFNNPAVRQMAAARLTAVTRTDFLIFFILQLLPRAPRESQASSRRSLLWRRSSVTRATRSRSTRCMM